MDTDPRAEGNVDQESEALAHLERMLAEDGIEMLQAKSLLKGELTDADCERARGLIGRVSHDADGFWHHKDGSVMHLTRWGRLRNTETDARLEFFEYTCWAAGGCTRIYITRPYEEG